MNDFEEMWDSLKYDIEQAVSEGYSRGFNNIPETSDGGKFIAYRYILDKMDKLDAEG